MPARSSSEPWRLTTPGRLFLLGPSQSGKSTFLRRLIVEASEVFDRPFRHVTVCMPSFSFHAAELHGLRRSLEEGLGSADRSVTFVEGAPRPGTLAKGAGPDGKPEPHLVVIEDLQAFPREDFRRCFVPLAVADSHHMNLTVLFCCQDFFHPPEIIGVKRSLTGVFLFRTLTDKQQYQRIGQHAFGRGGSDVVPALLRRARQSLGLNYVFLNFHPQSPLPEELMCQTAVLPSERPPGATSPAFLPVAGAEEGESGGEEEEEGRSFVVRGGKGGRRRRSGKGGGTPVVGERPRR